MHDVVQILIVRKEKNKITANYMKKKNDLLNWDVTRMKRGESIYDKMHNF